MIEHKHVLLRIEADNPPRHPEHLEQWMTDLITALRMELFAGPIVRYVTDPGNRGLTGVCIIKTSHIAMHVWDEQVPALIQLDVFTCGSLDLQDVFLACREFHPRKIEYKLLDRENDLKQLAEGLEYSRYHI